MKLTVHTPTGKNAELEVSSAVFGQKPVASLLAQAVRIYLSNQRQGTSQVKTRADIARTKKKWYKQKGTGGARHGARTPSIFVGGAVAHGPTGLTDWSMKLTASQRLRAMVYALSAQAKNMVVADEVMQFSGKTKEAILFVNAVAGEDARTLIVLAEPVAETVRATNNLENVLVTQASRMNVYETLLADKIVLTEAAVRALEARLIKAEKKEAKKKTVRPVKTEKAVVQKSSPKVVKIANPAPKTAKRTPKSTVKKTVKKAK